MWPGFESRTWRYFGWVCCWFSSLLQGFFAGYSSFPPSTKTNISKFQFNLETVEERSHSVDFHWNYHLFYYTYYFICHQSCESLRLNIVEMIICTLLLLFLYHSADGYVIGHYANNARDYLYPAVPPYPGSGREVTLFKTSLFNPIRITVSTLML